MHGPTERRCLTNVFLSIDPPEMSTNQLLLVSTLGLGVNLFGMFAMGGHHHHVSRNTAFNHDASNRGAGRSFTFTWWTLAWFPFSVSFS